MTIPLLCFVMTLGCFCAQDNGVETIRYFYFIFCKFKEHRLIMKLLVFRIIIGHAVFF